MLLNCNIILYKNENSVHSDIIYKFIYETIISADDILNLFKYSILIGWVNNNHYILLYPKNFEISKNFTLSQNLNNNIINQNNNQNNYNQKKLKQRKLKL